MLLVVESLVNDVCSVVVEINNCVSSLVLFTLSFYCCLNNTLSLLFSGRCAFMWPSQIPWVFFSSHLMGLSLARPSAQLIPAQDWHMRHLFVFLKVKSVFFKNNDCFHTGFLKTLSIIHKQKLLQTHTIDWSNVALVCLFIYFNWTM